MLEGNGCLWWLADRLILSDPGETCHIPLEAIVTCFKDNFLTSTPPLLLRSADAATVSGTARVSIIQTKVSSDSSGSRAHGRGWAFTQNIPTPRFPANIASVKSNAKKGRKKKRSSPAALPSTRCFMYIPGDYEFTGGEKNLPNNDCGIIA